MERDTGTGTAILGFPASSQAAEYATAGALVSPAKPCPGSNVASVVVTGVTGIAADSSVSAFLVASDSTADHNAYEHEILDLRLSCDSIVPGVGFSINAYSKERLDGDFKVRYAWSTP